MSTFAFFALGAVMASFIGLVAARLYTGAPLVAGRSTCDACGVTLSPYVLIPVLSWLLYGGRCVVCKTRFGASSTVAELVLGLLFALAYVKFGLSPVLIPLLIALTLLAGLVLYDLTHGILPPVLLWPFVLAAAAVAAYTSPDLVSFAFTGCVALFIGSMLAVVHAASGGRAMGLADAPLAFGLSLIAGGALALSGLIFSFWVGGVVGIFLLARRASGTTISSEVPFAPFLAAGFLLVYFTSWDAFALVDAALRATLG